MSELMEQLKKAQEDWKICGCYECKLEIKAIFANAVIEHYTTSKSLGDHKDSHNEICEAAKWLKEQETT